MRVLTVLGARPQFIKAAVVSAALRDAGVQECIVHTGQHYEASMSDVFFEQLGLPAPEHHLGIASLGHGAMTGRMLERIEEILARQEPDWMLVYGDTNSTLAGALAASKLHVPVAHVEAGMRSFNRRMPEEINRVVTDHLSSLLLVTSETPARLLADEGITRGVHVVGDVMFDAKVLFAEAARATGARATLGLEPGSYGLFTLHRAENTEEPQRLASILDGIRRLGEMIPVILPLHPRLRETLRSMGRTTDSLGVRCIEPVGYLEMQDLESGAKVILTDSGGVQKEALFHSVPCVTLRDETEWTETVDLGWNALVGADADALLECARAVIDTPPQKPAPSVYGDGDARRRIAELLAKAPVAVSHESGRLP